MMITHSGLRWNPSFTSKYNQWKTDENGKLVRDEKEATNIFNDFFVNAIYKYENHPSVIAINHMKAILNLRNKRKSIFARLIIGN